MPDSTAPEATAADPEANDGNPFDPSRARRASMAADVVGGAYVAELCRGLTSAGRKCVARLDAVKVADLAALNLIGADVRPTEDDVFRWYDRQGRIWNPPPKAASRTELRVAVGGIDPKACYALADVVAAAEDGQAWAGPVVEHARDLNKIARRDRRNGRSRPGLFSPADLLDLGVSLETIAATPSATTAAQGRSVDILDAWNAEDQAQARTRAREAEAARAAALVDIPDRVNLAEHVPGDVRWTVDRVLARGAVLGLFAERKAGKTTVVRELVRSALHGEPFLGQFAVTLPAEADVVLFDTEMPLDSLHEQYQRAEVEHLERLNLRPLRGREQALDARVAAVRERWREQIVPGSLVVVDCIYSLFGALGVSENSDEVSASWPGCAPWLPSATRPGWSSSTTSERTPTEARGDTVPSRGSPTPLPV
ncbi:AAA family ATPase [Mycolicibacterium fortuitum]|uniref:AAA family ATPase n=1 Tax=Mycolicibacterium fortuitum TaxID=1766 RepID=UPI000AED1ABA|nr:AAA family ATPase [Mycolicibacterium fortuitum]